MSTIWKIPLTIQDTQQIMLPKGYEFLHVDMQGFQLWMWVILNPEAEKLPVTIVVKGTGHWINEDYDFLHLGTVLTLDGLVWHVFEELV